MKQKYIDAVKIGAVVTLLIGVGLGIFLFSGSVETVVFAAIGIPAGLLVYGYFYQRRQTTTSSSTSARLRTLAEDVAGELQDLLAAHGDLRGRGGFDPIEIDNDVSDLCSALDNRGFDVDPEARSVAVGDVDMGMGALDNYRRQIRSVEEDLVAAFADHGERAAEEMSGEVDRLVDAELLPPDAGIRADGDRFRTSDPATLRDRFQGLQEEFVSALDRAVRKVESLGDGDGLPARGRLEERVYAGAYAEAVDVVIEARDDALADTSGEFESRRDQLQSLQRTILDSPAASYAGDEHVETVRSSMRTVEELDSALDDDKLTREWSRTREAGRAIVDALVRRLDDRLDTARSGEFSVEGDELREPNVEGLRSRLEAAGTPKAFEGRWTAAVEELRDAIDAAEIYTEAHAAYPEVAPAIDRVLDAEGQVQADDVPYTPPGPIMELYAAKNPGVRYLSNRTMLTPGSTGGPAEPTDDDVEFDLRVRVEAAVDDPPELTVVVDGSRPGDRRTETLAEPGDVVFESLAAEEYTVTLSTEEASFRGEERNVFLDADADVTVSLGEIGPVERICDGIEDETRPLLSEVAELVAESYDEHGYLDTDVDLPVMEAYQPCLLAMWADDRSLDLHERADGGVLVYDRDRTTRRLENLIGQKLERGDSMTYDEIIERYLTIPADDELLRDVLAGSGVADDLELEADRVVKR